MRTFVETVASTEDGLRALNQERAILELTEAICDIMERDGVTRSELARWLGKSKGYVTQLLGGRANMTIRTISDIFTALGRTLRFSDELRASWTGDWRVVVTLRQILVTPDETCCGLAG
jgi:transcriptional regulator with XRE-family HTH domain